MKRLIIFLLLFAALKVAGQTIGHLRFDTVMIYKVGGTAELVLLNKTKDSLGVLTNYGNGRTRFIKSRAINDSTIVVGLDTMTIRGAGGFTASNGLTKTGSNIQLGGDLLSNTTIGGGPTLQLTIDAKTKLARAVIFNRTTTGDANYSVTDSDFLIELDAITTDRTITMPSPAGANVGRMLIIANKDSVNTWNITGNVVTMADPEGSQITFNSQQTSILISDGSNWVVHNSYPEATGGGGGSGSTDTTELGFPLYVSAPTGGGNDTLKILRDSAYSVTHIIQDTLGVNLSPRSTAGSLIEYPNGALVVGYSFYFGASIGDQDSAKIAFRRSYDRGGSWTEPNFVTPPGGGKLTYVPSLMLLGDTLHMIAPVVNSSVTNSEFYHFKSVDTGKTWNAGANIDWVAGMKTHGSHRLYKSHKSNRIFYPWAINTPGSGTSSSSGHWEGRISYSDDNMVTWTMHPTLEVISDDSAVMETEIHESSDSLYYTWRGRTGWMLYIASGDDGNTWSQPTAVNQYTANFGIQKPNSMHSIKQVHNDRLWLAIVNPVFEGEISNSGTARRKVSILASTSGKPRTFYPAQLIKFDTTGGRTYGDINICITTDYAYALYYVGNRNNTGFQYGMTRIPLNKFSYLGVTDSLPRLLVKHKGQYHDTVIAKFADDKVMPAGISDIGAVEIATMPRNGVQDFTKFMPGIVGRGYGSGAATGLIIQGISQTNSAVGTTSNWDAGIVFDARSASGVLSNYPLVSFTNNANIPYLRAIPNGTWANLHFTHTAMFGSSTLGASTYQLQVRNDVTHTSLGVENRNNDGSQNRVDFLKLRGSSQPNSSDYIGGFTFNNANNYFRAIGSGLTNSVTSARLVNYALGSINQANSNIEIMRWTSEGLVGVGTSAPIDKLHVSGTVRITDTLKMPNLILKTLDTTNFKISVSDANGNIFKMHWPSGGGSDNWGTQVVETDATLTGDGTVGSPLSVVGGAGGDHGALTGLTDDDHTQYALLAGRSGGQSITGGPASGDDLTLLSTSHGTKGNIFFGTASTYDQVNDRWGFGTTSPGYKLDMRGTSGGNIHIVNDADDDGLYMSFGTGLYYHGWGSNYTGSVHTAKATSATLWAMFGSSQAWYTNSGLTIAANYTPTERMRLTTTGLGIGTNSPDVSLHVESATAGTNQIVFPFRLSHTTSATATTGLGIGMQAELENASGTMVVGGTLAWPLTDATAASEDVDFIVNLMAGGSAVAEKFRITSTGVARFNNAFSFPTTDGTSGQVLQTNGSGAVTWQTVSGGALSGLTAGRVTLSTGATSIGDDANLLYSSSNGGILSVGTTNTQGHFNIGGNKSMSSSGAQMFLDAATYTDNATSASGSASWSINLIAAPTIAATNSNVSVTGATTLHIQPPTAGTNVTFTTPPYAIYSEGAIGIAGGLRRSFGSQASGSTVNHTMDIITCSAAGGNYTITLPDAANYTGFTFTFKRTDASGNTCVVGTTSSQTIDGSTTFSLTAQYKYVTVVSDGSNWLIVAQN